MLDRCAVHARRHGAAGAFGGDAPQVAETKGIRLRARAGDVVQVVEVFVEEGGEALVVGAAVECEEFGASLGQVGAFHGILGTQAFGGRDSVTAQKRVGDDVGAVSVVGIHVGRHGAGGVVLRVGGDAVQLGLELVITQPAEVGDERFAGDLAGGTERERAQVVLVEAGDLINGTELIHDFLKVARERSRPAEGVDTVGERSGDEFFEAVDHLDAGVGGRES